MIPAAKIDTSKIPPLEGRMLGATFYKAMVQFYENPDNVRRFEEWQKEQKHKEGVTYAEDK